MKLEDWIKKYYGKYIDLDGKYGAQCVEFTRQYMKDCLGVSLPIVAAAKDIAAIKLPMKWIKNERDTVPEWGDVAVWDESKGAGCGHVAIVISGDKQTFASFEQNWPVGAPGTVIIHDYKGVLGFWR